MNEQQLETLFAEAQNLVQTGFHSEAYKKLKKLDEAVPDHPGILYLTGICQSMCGKKTNAISTYLRVIRIYPQFVEALNNLALDYAALNQFDKAFSFFEKALSLRPDFVEAYLNKAVLLTRLRRYEEAIRLLNQSLLVKPNYSDAMASLGFIYASLKDFSRAQDFSDKAIALNPHDVKALNNLASIFNSQSRRRDALQYLERAFSIDQNHDWLQGLYLDTMLRVCDWSRFEELKRAISEGILHDKNVCRPFQALSFIDNAKIQKICATHYIKTEFPTTIQSDPFIVCSSSSSRIKIGYFSSEFRNHAVSFLTAGLFEQHDRSKFEIFGFDLGHDDKSDMRSRIRNSFDHFVHAEHLSDHEVASLARSQSIDIAVDLTGITGEGRLEIFARRAAPLQINYLGYPGTSGADFFDYIVGDSVVTPPDMYSNYSEKIICLPDCFQANDDLRQVSTARSREHFGLNPSGVVFGAFNQPSKFNQDIFLIWISILLEVPNSQLWLIEDNTDQIRNLRNFAKTNGLDPDRLIFSGGLPYNEHLARYQLMDLALDTFPFNGGTTTSDALWGGAPVLTLLGEAFASRMSASLLHSIGLDDLIQLTPEGYRQTAIFLGNNPRRLSSLKASLATNREIYPLFDTLSFTRHLESGYELIVEKHRSGQAPDHILVPKASQHS